MSWLYRAPLRAVALLVIAVLLPACTGGDDPAMVPPSEAAGSEAAVDGEAPADQIDVDAVVAGRLDLEHALALHSALAAEAMRAVAGGGRDAEKLREAMNAVTADVAAAHGDMTAEDDGLDGLLDARSNALLALAAGDAAARDLRAAQRDIARSVAPDDDAAGELHDLLAGHDDLLIEALEDHKDGDFEAAMAKRREAFSAAVTFARDVTLSGVTDPAARNMVTTGRVELRSALRQLIGEHAVLATVAGRRGPGKAAPFEAATSALNGNTEDLTAALLTVAGQDAAVTFDEHWRGAIGAVFARSAAEGRRERRTADRNLAAAVDGLAEEVEVMTGEVVTADDAAQVLARHFDLLGRHAAAVVDIRPARALALATQAYGHSTELADLIAEGVADHRPDDFPSE